MTTSMAAAIYAGEAHRPISIALGMAEHTIDLKCSSKGLILRRVLYRLHGRVVLLKWKLQSFQHFRGSSKRFLWPRPCVHHQLLPADPDLIPARGLNVNSWLHEMAIANDG